MLCNVNCPFLADNGSKSRMFFGSSVDEKEKCRIGPEVCIFFESERWRQDLAYMLMSRRRTVAGRVRVLSSRTKALRRFAAHIVVL